MKSRWRDIRLVAQAVLITSAVWMLLFYLFGDRLPTAPTTAQMAGSDRAASSADDAARPPAQSAVPPRNTAEGQRVAMADNAAGYDGRALVIPVAGVTSDQLVDSYQDARSNGERTHEAIDIMADAGTPVYAAAPGTVEKLFWSDLGGNTVYVRSADKRTIYYYAHLDAYRQGLREGQQVRAGSPLGTVGSTGNADPSGPHLHFAILMAAADDNWSGGAPVNPYPLLRR